MNFRDFFHEFFQFSLNLGLAATFQIFKLFLVFGDSFLPNSVQWTQIVVSTKMHAIHAIQCYLSLILSPCCDICSDLHIYQTEVKFSMTFHDQKLNFMTFQGWKMKFVNYITFQVFHDPYESIVQNNNKRLEIFWLHSSIAVCVKRSAKHFDLSLIFCNSPYIAFVGSYIIAAHKYQMEEIKWHRIIIIDV